MINTNYNIDALEFLLNKDCLSERYYPLIQFKQEIITKAKKLGYKTKDDIAKLSDADFIKLGIKDETTIKLLRRFLIIYDPNPQKFKEIEKLNLKLDEKIAYKELYYLPGVKQIRASLYFLSGYKTLKDIANSNVNEIIKRTESTISMYKLSCIVPLEKEVRTHIAVAKVFTQKN